MEKKAVLYIILGCIVTFLYSVVAVTVKLTGGIKTNSFYFGILNVNHNNEWGTVCDDNWNTNNTKVVCSQLGYQQGKAKNMGTGTGRIWMDDVACTGSESSIVNCKHRGWGVNDCSHGEDIGIACFSLDRLPNVAFRLTDTRFGYVGRVEVRYSGTWGALCPDTIGLEESHVICRMLGYSRAQTFIRESTTTVSKMRFSFILKCFGNESSVEECSTKFNGINTCGTSNGFWLLCKPASGNPNVAVRLVNGSTPNQGRVEVRYYGVWGTVCDDGWGLKDAHVVCRMLNYSKASWAGTAIVKGRGFILLDDVWCRGMEKSLEHCKYREWGQHDCSHSEDAGVRCENVTKEELLVTARLVAATQNHIGFVEINYNGTWRPVCDDSWDIADAHVICRMLGYRAALAPMRQSRRGVNGLWMGGVECGGDEDIISQCSHHGWSNFQCSSRYYAGVMCKASQDLPPTAVRLVGGHSPNSGRVEVRYGNVWGTICNRGLDINDAKVICRMLGYMEGMFMYFRRIVNVTIWLSNLECNGTERSIFDCRHPGWGETALCSHNNDVGVTCMRVEAPHFFINGTNAVTESTVDILFKDSPRLIHSYFESVYQVAVEKRHIEHRFKSYEQPQPFVYNELNITMATEMGNESYITMEILGPISNLTIGDGQYYNGYYNAPLEPGSMYRVHVRIVTMAMDGKKVAGYSSFVAFTTKSHMEAQEAEKPKEVSSRRQGAVTGLSVAMIALICATIGLVSYFRLKLKKAKEKRRTTTVSEMTEVNCPGVGDSQHEPHYQPLNLTCKEEDVTYENISQHRNSRYQVAKPVSKALLYTETQVEEDFYQNT